MKSYRLKIFCEFRIILSDSDSIINSLKNFIPEKSFKTLAEIEESYNSENLSTREYFSHIYDLVSNFPLEISDSDFDLIKTKNSFKEFISFCKENDHELFIVSDIFDLYIHKELRREKISSKYFSGERINNPDSDKLEIFYPYTDDYCKLCNTCKRNILISNTNDLGNEISVYIGDGISDQCVSGFADIVFAKGKLASYCWKNNITYFEFDDFSDIISKLIKPENNKFIKQRNEALVRRRDVLMGG
ncbi:MAG: hypothetical protein WAT71_07860 [Ignavibacteria bacterium]